MENKPILKKPTTMGKKLEKNFKSQMHSQGANSLFEVDNLLSEKEQSLKKQIWDLAKMESLVHSDPKLSAKYNEMAETGEETYGYHYNETIMNILFNDYVLNSPIYLEKYKNAIPVKKDRRDKSGISQLQKKGIEKMKKKTTTNNDTKSSNNQEMDNEKDSEIKETTGAASSGSFASPLDFKTNRDLTETTTSASSGAYVGPFGTHRHNKLNKPIWNGGVIIGENVDYLTDANVFKKIFESYQNEDVAAINVEEPIEEAINTTQLKNLDTQFLERILNSLFTTLQTTKQKNPEIDRDISTIQQELRSRGVLNEPTLQKKGITSRIGSFLRGEGVELDEHHLNTKEQKVDFILQHTNKTGEPLSSQELMELPDETINIMYNDLEKSLGMTEGDDVIDEKAKSKAQQRFMGMVRAAQKGELDNPSPSVEKAADSMSKSDVEDFASTKHDDLPERVSEDKIETGPDSGVYDFSKEKDKFSSKNLPKRIRIGYDSLFLTDKGLLFPTNANKEEITLNSGKKEYKNLPLDVEWYVDPNEWKNLNRSIAFNEEINNITNQNNSMNEYSELDKEVLSRGVRKKLPLSQLLELVSTNVLLSPNQENAVEQLAASKGLTLDQLRNVADYYLETNLGYQGYPETPDQEALDSLIQIIDDMTGQEEPVEEPVQQANDVEEAKTSIDSNKGIRTEISAMLSQILPDFAGDVKRLSEFTDATVELFFNGDYNKAFHYIRKRVKDITQQDEEIPNEGIISSEGPSMIKDDPTSMSATMKDFQQSFGEGVNEEIKKCRKDEKPVPGKLPGEKGACEKKHKIDPEERKKNKYNVEMRLKREKEREKRIEQRKKETHSDVLEKNKKQMKKLKEMIEGIESGEDINEDKRPSALVQLDRIHKQNEKNFNTDLKDSNTSDLKTKEFEMESLGEYSEVGDNPYELAEKIEKEKLEKIAKLQKDNSALKNVGDSTNDNDMEIPKRNLTTSEVEQLELDRGLGMQDIIYDNKPSERFVERMKKDMGEDIYDHAQKKMEYRKNAPMYNKDTQPVSDGMNKLQFDKNEKGFNDKKGIKTESVITAKYNDEFNKTKFVNFKLNETIEVKESEGILLNLEGLGNLYTQSVNENTEMRNIINSFNFFLDNDVVVRVPKKQMVNENKTSTSSVNNDQLEKIKKLFNYDPNKIIDTKNVKKNRGF